MARLIRADALDRRITFQAATATQDPATGAYVYGWDDIAVCPTVWAQVRDVLSGSGEGIEDGIAMARRRVRIRIRYRSDITSDMRIMHDGRKLRIIAPPAEIGRRRGLEIIGEVLSTEGSAP